MSRLTKILLISGIIILASLIIRQVFSSSFDAPVYAVFQNKVSLSRTLDISGLKCKLLNVIGKVGDKCQSPRPTTGNGSSVDSVNNEPTQGYPVSNSFPAQRKVNTGNLVIYQVWLNYYAQNSQNQQPSSNVFVNAANHLPKLADMGITTIQLSPVHPFGRLTTIGSPYGIKDFYDVNPGYAGFTNPKDDAGTRDARISALKNYIDTAHGLGLQVIMDCVYHSTDPNNVLVNSHPDFYLRKGGQIVKNRYGFSVLDYSNPQVQNYMMEMTKYWAKTVGIDGCRSDVAIDVPLSFWASLNNELKKMKPAWLMVAETSSKLEEYGSPYTGAGSNGEKYQSVYGFDALYGVTYMQALRAVINNRREANVIQLAWERPEQGKGKPLPDLNLYRAIDNHDQHPRAAALSGRNKAMLAAMAINFTLDGLPFIFNGQEIGDLNPTSIANQRYISWSRPPHPENTSIYKQLISLRKSHPALNSGTTIWYSSNNPSQVISYLRSTDKEKIIVVVNLSETSWSGTVMGDKLLGTVTDLLSSRFYTAQKGSLSLTLEPYSYLIASVK
ncbi:alpha-glucosidase C-terminal domain-containing protein [Candidatus Microgenomates bacterium]|nr:alpha-glucosidase C-terminal domain-containing protein [Candidatus Microgenomates bacterium]